MTTRSFTLALFLAAATLACGSEEAPTAATAAAQPAAQKVEAPPEPATPASLPNGIVLALAQFVKETDETGKEKSVPGPARAEFLFRKDGKWQTTALEDTDSNVFHKVMVYDAGDGPRLLTAGGTGAYLKAWDTTVSPPAATILWEKDFGGKWSRMREAEVGDIYGDGKLSIAVATHDQGVVAVLRPSDDGYEINEIDANKDLPFVHEIELGDLDGDGVMEVYATPSEPNRLDGRPQSGNVARYVPAKGEGPTVVADLGDRHAKEILVADIDGDGRDELYVSVEGKVKGKGSSKRIEEPVEIRRYESDTPAGEGVVIGTIQDSLTRFLTTGDVDGDGKKELVAASYSSGIWMFRPGSDPMTEWQRELIDRDSAGFEHAAILTDLDGDGVDELYVASDRHKEVRRYVWNGKKMVRETIYKRPDDRPIFTWNLMPVPVELIPQN